jgi:hypothetical protein
MTKIKCSLIFITIFLSSLTSFALNLHELKVYGYETADPNEYELENISSYSSDQVVRSSFELTYGLNEHWEVSAYLDYTQASPNEKFHLDAVRSHVRTSLFKPNQYVMDIGLEVEVELPQEEDEYYTVDGKIILEKRFNSWTVVLAPAIEFVKLKERDSDGKDSKTEHHYEARLQYAISDQLQPHLDFFGELDSDQKHIAMAAVDYNVRHGLQFSAGLGVGTNSYYKESLAKASVEFEIE